MKTTLQSLLIAIRRNPSRLPIRLAIHLFKFERAGLVISTRNKKGKLILKATSKLKQLAA